MPYIELDTNGWAVRSYTTSGANAGFVAYVSAAGNDGTGVVYRIGSVTVGTDPHAPAGSPATFLTVQAALDALETAMGGARSEYQGLCLLKRGDAVAAKSTGDGLAFKHSGPSISQPFTLGYYGTSGARPQMLWSKGTAILARFSDFFAGESIGGIRNVLIDGLHWVAHKRLPSHADYNPDNTAVTALNAATNQAGVDAARASSVSGVAAKDVTAGRFETNVENKIENITIQDSLVSGASGGFSFSRQTSASPLVKDFFVNRVGFDRIYNHHGPAFPGANRSDGRTNAIFWSGVQSGRAWHVAMRYIGFLPSSEDSRASIIRHDQSQGLYCQEDFSDNVDVRGIVGYKGSFACVQLRGGNGNSVRGVVASGWGTGASAGHRQSDYDIEGQTNLVGSIKAPRFNQSTWSKIVVEAPDTLTNGLGNQGQGFQVRRMHGFTVDKLLVHRGNLGTAFGAIPLNVWENGKPNPSTGALEPCELSNVVVADYLRDYAGGERWNIGGTNDPANVPFSVAPAPNAPHVTFRSVKVNEPLASSALLGSVLAQPGGTFVNVELFSQNRNFVSSFNRGASEVQRDFDATVAHLGGTGWQWRAQTFPEPTRDMGAFAVAQGVALSGDSYQTRVDKLLDACFANWRNSWDADLNGETAAEWILAGYGLGAIVNPPNEPELAPITAARDTKPVSIPVLPRATVPADVVRRTGALWEHLIRLQDSLAAWLRPLSAQVQVMPTNISPAANGLYPASYGRGGSVTFTGTQKVVVTVRRGDKPAPAGSYLCPVVIRGGTVVRSIYPKPDTNPDPWIETVDTGSAVTGWLVVDDKGRAEIEVAAGLGTATVLVAEPLEVAASVGGGAA